MKSFVGLDAFYQTINKELPLQAEVGHFNIFKVEDLALPAHKPVAYSRRDFFKVSLVTGRSKIHYADQTMNVDGSVLVFTNPMIPYFWERLSETHTGYVCIFTEAFFSHFGNIKDYPVFQSASNGVLTLKENEVNIYNNLFSSILNELNSEYIFKYDLIKSLLLQVIHGAQKMQPTIGNPLSASTGAERISGLFIELLERQFPIEVNTQVVRLNTPADFARQMNIHVNHLNKALKETTGRTTSQLIQERVLQEARILLKSTTWSVNEIAWCLGFEEPNHFSTYFKGHTGLTPKHFRLAQID